MAATSISTWVPVAKESLVSGKDVWDSAIYLAARQRPTRTAQTDVPRLVEADVNGGDTLTDDTNSADVVSMYDYLYNGKRVVSEAEFEDAPANALDAAATAWLMKFNKSYDNASIGVTAARSATASAKQPYTSIYKAVITNDNSGAISYTANTNLVQSATAGGVTYADLSNGLAKVEANEFWDPMTGVVIMHPGLMGTLRTIVDGGSRYVFQESTSGDVGGHASNPNDVGYRLFGLPVLFSHGAKTSSSFAMTETGNKLIVFVNKQYIVRGDHTPVESRFIPAAINPSALQHIMQFRARQGFVLTNPFAAAVVEARS